MALKTRTGGGGGEMVEKAKGKAPKGPKAPREGTKKAKVFEVWKAGGAPTEAIAAALTFVGQADAGVEKKTRGSVYCWYGEFRKKFK